MTSINYNRNIQSSCQIQATSYVPVIHAPKLYRVNFRKKSTHDILAVLQCELLRKLRSPDVNDFIVSLVLASRNIDPPELDEIRENKNFRSKTNRMKALLDLFWYKEATVLMEFMTLLVNLPDNPRAAAEFRDILNTCFPDSVQKVEEESPACTDAQTDVAKSVEDKSTNISTDKVDELQSVNCDDVPCAVIFHSTPPTTESENYQFISVESSKPRNDAEVDPTDQENVAMLNGTAGREMKSCKWKWSDKKNVLICFLAIALFLLVGLVCNFALRASSNNILQPLEAVSTFQTTTTSDYSQTENVMIIESEASNEEYRYRFGRENSKRFTISK